MSGRPDRHRKQSQRRRRGRSPKQSQRPSGSSPIIDDPVQFNYEQKKHIPRSYGVLFFDSFDEAKRQKDILLNKAKEVDQLNIVVKQEGPMDDPDLLQYGKLFAGEAWTLIHKRRVEEGWYEKPQ